jgi:hypothetical protein
VHRRARHTPARLLFRAATRFYVSTWS